MTFSHTVWASQVAAAADLPEKRLDKRLTAIFVETIEHPSASIPKAAGSWDARAGGNRSGGPGGRGEIQVPVADRGSTLGNQERLPGGEFAAGDMGRTGEGSDSQRGSGGADRVPAGPGAGDPRGTGDGGFERR